MCSLHNLASAHSGIIVHLLLSTCINVVDNIASIPCPMTTSRHTLPSLPLCALNSTTDGNLRCMITPDTQLFQSLLLFDHQTLFVRQV